MRATLNALAQTGLMIEFHDRGIKVSANGPLRPLALSTSPFPGFATDMQAQFMAMLALAEGDRCDGSGGVTPPSATTWPWLELAAMRLAGENAVVAIATTASAAVTSVRNPASASSTRPSCRASDDSANATM